MNKNEAMELNKANTLNVAVKVLRKQGILNTKRSDIAKKANITTRTLNTYFGTQEGLLSYVAKRICEEDIELRSEYLKQSEVDKMTGYEMLNFIFDFEFKKFLENPEERMFIREISVYVHRQSSGLSKLAQSEFNHNLFYKKATYFETILQKGVLDKSLRPDIDCETYSYLLAGTLYGTLEKGSGLIDNINTEEYKQTMIDIKKTWNLYKEMVLENLKNKN